MPNPGQALIPADDGVSQVTSLAEAMSLARSRARELVDDPDPDPYGFLQDMDRAWPNAGLLDAQWSAQPGDPRWEKRLRARGRKAEVSRYFLMGRHVHEIARLLSVSEATVYRDLGNLQREWRDSHMADIEALAGQDLARLDFLLTKLADGVERGDVNAIKASLDIVKERASILGYRAGVQVDMEEYIRSAAEAAGIDPSEALLVARRVSIRFQQ